jgi:hypothetical protein
MLCQPDTLLARRQDEAYHKNTLLHTAFPDAWTMWRVPLNSKIWLNILGLQSRKRGMLESVETMKR